MKALLLALLLATANPAIAQETAEAVPETKPVPEPPEQQRPIEYELILTGYDLSQIGTIFSSEKFKDTSPFVSVKLVLNPQSLGLIAQGLSGEKYRDVAPLVDRISKQVQEQQQRIQREHQQRLSQTPMGSETMRGMKPKPTIPPDYKPPIQVPSPEDAKKLPTPSGPQPKIPSIPPTQ